MKEADPIYIISVEYDGKKIIHPMGFKDFDHAVQWIETRNPKPAKILDQVNRWYSPAGVFTIHIINLW